MNATDLTPQDRFSVGSKALLPIHSDSSAPDYDANNAIEDIRVRIGTLLRTEHVAILLGAGASVDCGGPLLGTLPLRVERQLTDEGVVGMHPPRVRRWLRVFYMALDHTTDCALPVTRDAILARRTSLASDRGDRLPVNLERVLATLYRWRSVLPDPRDRLRIDCSQRVAVTGAEIDTVLDRVTHALAMACDLPTADRRPGLVTYEMLVRQLLTRPLDLPRVKIFTLNYDTLVEQATDTVGAVLLDGFVGTHRRVFRPESYGHDLYFPTDTAAGRVHRLDRVLHLYKLHGSVTWTIEEPYVGNPYGVRSIPFRMTDSGRRRLLIYPTPVKYREALHLPYSELFRHFANAICRPQSVLIVIGYGFGDKHVNSIVHQALAVSSFTLVVVDKCPRNDFVTGLRMQRGRRVWLLEGPNLGTFAGFVNNVLPDLYDETINKSVLATRRELGTITGEHRAISGDL